MNKGARYFDEINFLRAFAILAVISIHVAAFFTHMSGITFQTSVYMAIYAFSHFAVPLFICISGFVLYNKYYDAIDIKTFLKKRLGTVLPPFLIFSTFYLGVTLIGSIILTKSVTLDISHILYRYYPTDGCLYHLWFFVLIIQFYLIYPAIVQTFNYCKSRDRTLELLVASFFIGVIYKLYLVSDMNVLRTSIPLLGVATMFVGYLFYFILGMVFLDRYDEMVLKYTSHKFLYWMPFTLICGTIIGTFGYAREYFNYSIALIHPMAGEYWHYIVAIITPLYYVCIFAICFIISLYLVSHRTRIVAFLEKIGRYSFSIYLIHVFILSVLVLAFSQFGFDINNWLFYPVTFCLTFILSYLSVEILQKLPYSKYIIGITR